MKPGFMIEKDEQLIFTGNYMEIYIPQALFDMGVAQFDGDMIKTLGVFNFKVFSKADEPYNEKDLKTFNFPALISLSPSNISTKEMELIKGTGSEKFQILKFYKDDIITPSTLVVASVDAVNIFIKLLNEAKLPRTLEYKEIIKLLLKNLEINKTNLNVSATLLSVIIATIYRDKNDMSQPFRIRIGKNPKTSQYEYVPANSRTVSAFNSTFSALTFEDIDRMLTSAINKKRYNRQEAETPIEQIIKV